MSKLHRPPAVPLIPYIWHSLRERRDINKAFLRFFEKYGDIVWLRPPGGSVYLVTNPAYIKHFLADAAVNNYPKNMQAGQRGIVMGQGLSSSEGAHWKRHRRMIQPAFQRDKVTALTPKIVGVIERLLDTRWEALARAGTPVELFPEMSRLVISAMGQIVYSEDPPDDVCEAAFHYMLYSIRVRSVVEEYLPMPRKLRRTYFLTNFPKVLPAAKRLNEFVWEKVRARMALAEQSDDLAGHFITTTDEKGEKLTDVEVRDEFIEFLYGGHVSAGIGLSWMWYCLTQYPEVRERMFDTVDRALGGRLPTVQDLPALQYVSQVFDETLRHYSPAPGMGRPAVQDDKLGEYDVPKGTMLMSSAYVMHRHPAYWKDPHTFDPSRFEPEQVRARPRFVYLPYGAGQRVCIGAQLASMIATLASAMVAQRFRLELMPGKPVQAVTGGAHYPENLWMKVVSARARLPASTSSEAPLAAVG
ncbi:cytochrome P450 [Pyxidicoccus fallax]|uniref:Cytochrome P450 n=1 Tax=Pyxidicoccus fallax TaxID=394095 RepID=A0A848LCH0_9BACT|nr:cytochrome P450 [Pyxidicoccus fallax]NMO16176.1 cytochrome P450 [Pyxidicoccus fallax]NPC77636.1 cytochrome P450 [Pyxidicoccus fallax]